VAALLRSARRVLGELRLAVRSHGRGAGAQLQRTGVALDAARLDEAPAGRVTSWRWRAPICWPRKRRVRADRGENDASGRDGITADSAPEGFDARLSSSTRSTRSAPSSNACRRSASSSTSISRRSTTSLPTRVACVATRGRSGPALDRLGAESRPAMSRSATSRSTSRSRMAQDAFRRFAADVVAPQAEAIHRDNLTVPEALLQALRELGVSACRSPSATAAAGPTTKTTRR
jgi:hypothetical protein